MIPLVLMAGFLGAGKTRFLTDVIPLLHARGVRVRVILNDFENASIDASRLSALDALVTPLNGECVCCSSLRELMDTLYAVPADPGSVMLIEANGATETVELLGFLTMEPRLAHFTPPLQLTVVDAGRWQKRWWHNDLEAAQASTATHVQLNWTHKLKRERLLAVEASVRKVNPRTAPTTPVLFADMLAGLVESVRDVPRRNMTDAPRPHAHAQGQAHTHEAAMHTHPFASTTMPLPLLVQREAFVRFVRQLPAAVVRAKGFVRFSDRQDEMFVWSRVQGRRGVQLDDCSAHAHARPVALFIGAHLPLDELAAQIAEMEAMIFDSQ